MPQLRAPFAPLAGMGPTILISANQLLAAVWLWPEILPFELLIGSQEKIVLRSFAAAGVLKRANGGNRFPDGCRSRMPKTLPGHPDPVRPLAIVSDPGQKDEWKQPPRPFAGRHRHALSLAN